MRPAAGDGRSMKLRTGVRRVCPFANAGRVCDRRAETLTAMHIRIGYELTWDLPQPTPMILTLHVHPSRRADLIEPDRMQTQPAVLTETYQDGFDNLCTRLVAPAGRFTVRSDARIQDPGTFDRCAPEAQQHPVETLPEETLVFLLGSRYCETERLMPIAWQLFGHIQPGWARVQAICDYVHRHISFGYQHARATRTAWEAHQERIGVCRDFTHLAVAFCRCLNIPARYCTGYLGDIGVPPGGPMDFSAWFEAYIGQHWHTFDPRNNQPRIGRVLIARGRDASDVAISSTFGPNVLSGFRVVTEELKPQPQYAAAS